MSGGSAPKTQTVTEKSTSDPWGPAQPYISSSLNSAYNLSQQGGPKYYTGQTVTPMSWQTKQGLDGIMSTSGMAGQMANAGANTLGQIMGPQNTPGSQNVANMANGGTMNPFLGGVAMTGMRGGNQTAMNTLTQSASGNLMGNPYLDQMVGNATNQVRQNVNGTFNAAGRYGSHAHQDTLQRGVGDVANQMYGQQYQFDMGNMLNSAGMLGSLQEQVNNRNLQGMGMGAGIYSDSLSQALNAFNSYANMQRGQNAQSLMAAGMLPGMYDFAQQGNRDRIGVGGAYENYDQSMIDAERERWDYEQALPYNNANWFNAIATGAGGLGQSTTTQKQVPYQAGNRALGALGGASAGAGIASALGLSGPLGWGALGIGALMGAI